MTLSKQLSIGLLIIGIFMMSATYLMLDKSVGILQKHSFSGLEREAKYLTYLIEESLLERYHDASIFPLVLGEVNSEEELRYNVTDPEFLNSLNRLVSNYKVYRRIGILDLNGQIIAENSRDHEGKTIFSNNISSAQISNYAWFRDLSAENTLGNDVFFYGPATESIDTTPNQYDLLIGSKILDINDQLIGYWINVLDFSIVEQRFTQAYKLLADKGLPYVELTLLDQRGNIIVDYDPTEQESAQYQRDFSVLGQLNLAQEGVEGALMAVSGLNGTVVSTHARKGIEQFTAYTHFNQRTDSPIPEWSTLIRVEHDVAYAEYTELMKLSKWIFVIAFILITSMWLLASRKYTLPLTRVTHAILDIVNGRLDSNIKKLKGHDEVSAINNALFELKTKLQERDGLLSEVFEKRQLIDLQRKTIDSMTSGIMVTDFRDPERKIIHVNKAMVALLGYSEKDLFAHSYPILWGDRSEPLSIQVINEAMANHNSCTCVVTCYRKDGSTFINNLNVDPVFDEHGTLTHYIFVHSDITEIKKDDEIARMELNRRIDESTRESREAAERLRTVFDTTIDGALVLNELGIIQDLNHSLELMFGCKKQQLLGQHFSALIADDENVRKGHEQAEFFKKEIRTLIGRVRTLKGRHKRGSIISLEVSAGEALLENENFFVVAIRDITEQQKIKQQQRLLQDKLKERETIYRTAFDQAAVGIARVGLDGQLIEVNQKICTNLGYSESELLKLGVSDITYLDDIAISRTYLQELMQGKQQFHSVEKRYVRKSGTVFWANLSISLVRSDDGSPKYFVSIIEDITERKTFENELKDARDHREELIRGINLASEAGGICNWSFNTVTGEMHWDPSTYELYGVEKGLPLTLSDWRCRLVEEDGLRMDSIIEHAIKNDLPIESEFRFTRKGENEIRWAKVAAATVYDEKNNPIKMFGINIEITEQKRITLELERETIAAQKANEAKSSFLATMSHEIRTPMNGVIGMIDLLKKTTLNDDQNRMVTTVRDSSFSLLEIIDDILDFSKIESGQIEIEWRPNSLLEVMEKTSGNLWVNAEKNGVDLVIEPDLTIPKTIAIDSLRIRQIILNLTGNAIKFSRNDSKRGLVKLVSLYDHVNKSLTIRIIDNGIGISKAQLTSLFKPFSQADSSTTRKFGGTGLGLSITKSFAGLMGGEVNVVSEVGVGSDFSVTIPITEVLDSTPQFELSMFAGVDVFISLSKPCFKDACCSMLTQLGVENITLLDKATDIQNYQYAETKQRPVVICDINIDSVNNRDKILALQIDDDPIQRKGYINPYHYIVAGHPLKPSEFVHGLGVLCGVVSPDFTWNSEHTDSHSSTGTSMLEQIFTQDKKVLVVEDHPTNQLVIGRQLDSLGIKHDIADDGVEGLKQWKAEHYDLVLTDCHMPNMDGFELTKNIRQIETQSTLTAVPIIAITANALVGESDNCLQAGMSDYISKPVEIEVLRSKLSHWLKLVDERNANNENNENNENNDDTTSISEPESPSSGLNLETLFAVIGTDDSEIVSEILLMYWESIQVEVEQIEQAAMSNDHAKLKSLAHASKGSSASSGASYLSDLFKQIEHNNEDTDLALSHLGLIKDELIGIEKQLYNLGVLQ